AQLTGFSTRWVLEGLRRLEHKKFIRTQGGRGAVKSIRLLPLDRLLLEGSKNSDQRTQKEEESPEASSKAKGPRAAAAKPKRRGAPIKELVEYIYSQPVTEDLINSLKVPGMNAQRLRIALEYLCRRPYRYEDRWGLISAIRAVPDY